MEQWDAVSRRTPEAAARRPLAEAEGGALLCYEWYRQRERSDTNLFSII
jgi:hypothetical protein